MGIGPKEAAELLLLVGLAGSVGSLVISFLALVRPETFFLEKRKEQD